MVQPILFGSAGTSDPEYCFVLDWFGRNKQPAMHKASFVLGFMLRSHFRDCDFVISNCARTNDCNEFLV